MIRVCSSCHSNYFLSTKSPLEVSTKTSLTGAGLSCFSLKTICSPRCTKLVHQSGRFAPPGTSQTVCSWSWRPSAGSGLSDPPRAATALTPTGRPQSGPGVWRDQTLQRDVMLILFHLIKTTFFTHLPCLLEIAVLTETSAGDGVPVVFTAVTFDLIPVTMISRRLAELNCVSALTSLVSQPLSCGVTRQKHPNIPQV